MAARIYIPSEDSKEWLRPHACQDEAGHSGYVKENISVPGLPVNVVALTCAEKKNGVPCGSARGWYYRDDGNAFFRGTGRCNLDALKIAANRDYHWNMIAPFIGFPVVFSLFVFFALLVGIGWAAENEASWAVPGWIAVVLGILLTVAVAALVVGKLTQPEAPPRGWRNGLSSVQATPVQRRFANSSYDDRKLSGAVVAIGDAVQPLYY